MTDKNNSTFKKLSDEKYPLVVKQMTIEETREYHRKRLFELSMKWSNAKKCK